MTRLPGLKAPEYMYIIALGVVSTTGEVYGAQSFYGRSFVLLLLLFLFLISFQGVDILYYIINRSATANVSDTFRLKRIKRNHIYATHVFLMEVSHDGMDGRQRGDNGEGIAPAHVCGTSSRKTIVSTARNPENDYGITNIHIKKKKNNTNDVISNVFLSFLFAHIFYSSR